MPNPPRSLFLWPGGVPLPPYPDGPLGLGSMHNKVDTPRHALNAGELLPIAHAYEPFFAWNCLLKAEAGEAGSVRICAAITSLPISISGKYDARQAMGIYVPKIEIQSFDPDPAYLERAIDSCKRVKDYIDGRLRIWRPQVELFIVTDLVIARGGGHFVAAAQMEAAAAAGAGPDVGELAGLGGAGSSPYLEMQARFAKYARSGNSFSFKNDCVLGYGLQKVRVNIRGSIERLPYRSGGLMSADDDEDDDDADDESQRIISLHQIDGGDVGDAAASVSRRGFELGDVQIPLMLPEHAPQE